MNDIAWYTSYLNTVDFKKSMCVYCTVYIYIYIYMNSLRTWNVGWAQATLGPWRYQLRLVSVQCCTRSSMASGDGPLSGGHFFWVEVERLIRGMQSRNFWSWCHRILWENSLWESNVCNSIDLTKLCLACEDLLDMEVPLSVTSRHSLMLAYESLLLAYAVEMQATLAIDLMDAIRQEGAEAKVWVGSISEFRKKK